MSRWLAATFLWIAVPALADDDSAKPAGQTSNDPAGNGIALGAHAGAVVALLGFPFAGPVVGAEAHMRLWDSVIVAPRVEAALSFFFVVGLPYVQAGAPLIVGPTATRAWTPYIGGGPLCTLATLTGFEFAAPPQLVLLGAEVLGGATVVVLRGLRAHIQLRGSMSVDVPVAMVLLGASATAGLLVDL